MELHESKQREPTPEEEQRIADWFAQNGRPPGTGTTEARYTLR